MNKSNAPSSIEVKPNAPSGLKLNKKTIISITVMLIGVLLFSGIMTQLIPRGEYLLDTEGRIINDTYSQLDDYKMPLWKIIAAPLLVFGTSEATTGILIIVFIILIGGTFLILEQCGTLNYMMASIIKKFGNKKYLLLCIMVFVCMALGSTAGILEEAVTIVPIAIALSLALGWDSFVGLSMSLVSIAFGFTAATFNPFNVMTVQRLAGLPIFSGLWLRLITFVLVYLVLIGFLIRYAKKIEKNPKKSLAYESDKLIKERFTLDGSDEIFNNKSIGKSAKAFVFCLIAVIVFIIIDFIFQARGMISMPAMALMFTLGGILAGYFTNLRGMAFMKSFAKGIKAIAPAIPLIVFVIAIAYILQEGKIIHTLLHYIYQLIEGYSPYSSILMLFAFVVILEFFIGSGTAKAFLIMPIVIPLADLVMVERQAVVLAFCLGDGFTNLLYPTSGIMILAIGLANISYGKWLKFSWKLFVAQGILSVILMLTAVAIGYS